MGEGCRRTPGRRPYPGAGYRTAWVLCCSYDTSTTGLSETCGSCPSRRTAPLNVELDFDPSKDSRLPLDVWNLLKD